MLRPKFTPAEKPITVSCSWESKIGWQHKIRATNPMFVPERDEFNSVGWNPTTTRDTVSSLMGTHSHTLKLLPFRERIQVTLVS